MSTLGRACALLGALILMSSRAARADPGLQVTAAGCPDLHAEEISRLLAIELGAAATERSDEALRVELGCDGTRLRIQAIDPVTDKRLERDVDLGTIDIAQDRVVAILVSQLFLSSWAELLLGPRQARIPELPPVASSVTPAVRRLAERRTRDALAPAFARPAWEVELLAGPRVRDLELPILTGQLGVRVGAVLGPVSLFVGVAGERGAASRSTGNVQVSLLEASVGVRLRVIRQGRFDLGIEASGGPTWMDLSGSSPAPGILASSTSGVVAEGALGVEPGVRIGAFRVALLLQVGANPSRARANVAGDADVSLAGPWFGANLSLGLAENPP